MSIWEEIKQSFKRGNINTKLIYINLGVFLIVNIIYVFHVLINPGGYPIIILKSSFENHFLAWLMVPASVHALIYKPWTIFTYMFLHFNFWHILFNMIWLYMFGRIFLMYLTEKQLLSTYILSGLSGAALFILSYNFIPGLKHLMPQSQMLGASAGVMGVAMGISFYSPNYTVYVPFIGAVRLKYIALFFIVTDIIQIASVNTGGHIAHLGGVIYAYVFILRLRKGKDIGEGLNNLFDNITTFFSKRRSKMKVSFKKSDIQHMTDMDYNQQKVERQKEVDRILDKIAKSGYDSLTKKEKETLFKMSGKN